MGIRAPHIIGASIATVGIALALFAIVPALQETPTTSTGLNALGHITLTIYDPDGNLVGYRQSDNFVINQALNNIQSTLFASAAGNDFTFLALCAGDTLRTSTTGCTGEMTEARPDGSAGGTSSTVGQTTGDFTRDVFKATITLSTGDDNITFKELALFDSETSGLMFSVGTFPDFLGQTGTTVATTYTITIKG